jgi:prepilin-type N-terminal cleavage/methylation domain-containing protein
MRFGMRTSRKSRRGFTLLEVLTVVAIIVILASMLIVLGRGLRDSAQTTQTKGSLGVLAGGMAKYLKNAPEPGSDWLPRLMADPDLAKAISGMKGFTGAGAAAKVNDAWGNPIVYLPSKNGPAMAPADPKPVGWVQTQKEQGFFWSLGPDGKPNPATGGGDDLFSDGVSP